MSLFPPALFSAYESGRGFLLILGRSDLIPWRSSCNEVRLLASDYADAGSSGPAGSSEGEIKETR